MDKDVYKAKFGLNRSAKLTGTNFIPNVTNDITQYNLNTRFKEGHKKSSKPKRLQTIKNRTGIKYNTKNNEK